MKILQNCILADKAKKKKKKTFMIIWGDGPPWPPWTVTGHFFFLQWIVCKFGCALWVSFAHTQIKKNFFPSKFADFYRLRIIYVNLQIRILCSTVLYATRNSSALNPHHCLVYVFWFTTESTVMYWADERINSTRTIDCCSDQAELSLLGAGKWYSNGANKLTSDSLFLPNIPCQ